MTQQGSTCRTTYVLIAVVSTSPYCWLVYIASGTAAKGTLWLSQGTCMVESCALLWDLAKSDDWKTDRHPASEHLGFGAHCVLHVYCVPLAASLHELSSHFG